ncbi:hypothetical protein LCGC14_1293720 [marine sediment metagenome]|uniref:Bulb-type lectin domain-containing protein n=1 Tax=marine sediment metagenome TaxID=412755 RepID=A0A0F9KRV8_9ZZZZ
MKNRQTFLTVLILILHFYIIVQGLNTFSNEQDDKDNKDFIPLLSASNSGAQQWNLTWGGRSTSFGFGVAVDSANNVYLAGRTSQDMVLVKYDSSGMQQWNRTWGGSNWDEGRGVAVDSSNNVYLAGVTPTFGAGSADMVLVKFGIEKREQAISGYDLLLFICVIGVITAISLHKKFFIRNIG